MSESDRKHDIDWGKLENKLPPEAIQTIRNFRSEKPELREQAREYLFDESWHQGSLYSDSIFIAPFFIKQLQYESEPQLLEYILLDLAHFTTGIPERLTRRDIDFDLELRYLLVGESIPEYRIEKSDRVGWAKFTYESIDRGIDAYLDYCKHPVPDVRVAVIYLLSCCRSETEKINKSMYELFCTEINEIVKATIFLYFAFISQASFIQSSAIDIKFIEGVVNSDESNIVQLSAAIALAFIDGKKISDANVNILMSLLERPNLLEELIQHYENPMLTAHRLGIIDFFENLSDRNLRKVLPSLREASQQIYPISNFLEIVFQDKKT